MEECFQSPETWKVIEDDPFPDDYISILAPGWSSSTFVPHSIHGSFQDAVERARELKLKWGVSKIYIFYPEGNHQRLVDSTSV